MSIDNRFNRGSKTSSSIMEKEITPVEVEQFMMTSFYLPVDVLTSRGWDVSPIRVMTGANFEEFVMGHYKEQFHFCEDKELLAKAQYVAVSARRKTFTRQYFYVCKIWYGAAPK